MLAGEKQNVVNFKIILAPAAAKFYKKGSLDLVERLNKCFEAIENNPFYGQNIKLLRTSARLYRYKAGDYRLIYEVEKEKKKVNILLISPLASLYWNIN